MGAGMTTLGRRLLTSARAGGMEEALAARLADPLWLLARQWQFGEFRGDDAGSVVTVAFHGVAHHATWWRPEPDAASLDGQEWQAWNVASGPLEPVIEAEPADGTARRRLRLDGGVRVRRALLAADLGHRAAAVAAFAPWPAADVEGAGGLDEAVLASVADGEVLAGLVAPWAAPDEPVPADVIATIGLQPAEVGPFASAVRTFVEWWQQRSSRTPPVAPGTPVDPPSWDPHRLEHRGTLAFAALPDVRLHVDQHPGGSVDWFSVDAALGDPSDLTDAPDAPQALAAAQPVDAVGVPTPATFAGMPAPRFWEFEDARVDYGSIDASPADLARLLLVQFTTVYGNDWLVQPVRIPVGALVRVESVVVTDSFGVEHDLAPFNMKTSGWRAYSLLAPADRPELSTHYYWSAPALPSTLESPPVERITMRRDEQANTAWAVVDRVADRFGRSHTVSVDVPQLPPARTPPQYLVATPVADSWYPVVPEQIAVDAVKLTLRALVRRANGEVVEARPPGSILAGGPGAWWIHEEELGRAGLTLDRRVQVGRWHDGRRWRWIARSAWPGAGEARSGLTWDVLV